jgi:uncharacterized membrane protein YhaH (DUF805 family)
MLFARQVEGWGTPMDLKYLFTSINGRINRKQFWTAVVTVAVAWIVVRLGTTELIARSSFNTAYILIIAMSVIGLVLFLVVVPVLIKRLHDRNKSGHYVWPLLGAVIGSQSMNAVMPSDESWPVLLADLVFLVIWLWYFVELGFFYGTVGPNSYGPEPLGTDPASAMSGQ